MLLFLQTQHVHHALKLNVSHIQRLIKHTKNHVTTSSFGEKNRSKLFAYLHKMNLSIQDCSVYVFHFVWFLNQKRKFFTFLFFSSLKDLKFHLWLKSLPIFSTVLKSLTDSGMKKRLLAGSK